MGLVAVVANTACSHSVALSYVQVSEADKKSIHEPTAAQRALGIYQPFSDADIDFMTGMIPHHAQAVIMAGWAPSHGARSDVRILCERIGVGQADEIRSMQTWLGDRGLPVPDAKSTRMKMKMNGVEHEMLMPGMLSDEEMTELDNARGPEFDRLFLLGMIRHHQGAIDMVNELFKAYGAAQDDAIYKFASDVYADQEIEIAHRFTPAPQAAGGGNGIDARHLAQHLAEFGGDAFGIAQQIAPGALSIPGDRAQHLFLKLGTHAGKAAQLLLLTEALEFVDGADNDRAFVW